MPRTGTAWTFFACLSLAMGVAKAAPATPTPTTANEERVEGLLAQITFDEKITMVAGAGFESRGIPRLGIPPIKMTDGPLGARWSRATAFPAPILIGASFDPQLAQEVAAAMAIETRALGRDMLLAPCIGLARHPLGGRNFESYGEDPYLNSQMATAVVAGLQGEGVIASAKHFAVNDQEFQRAEIDTIVDERALEELHFPMFRAAVRAGVWSAMASYNKINGDWASENRWLLTDVLKNAWSFSGFVVSDWWATHQTERAANAGLDLEMPTPAFFDAKLADAVRAGRVSQATIDDKVRRLLRAIVGIGLLEPSPRPAVEAIGSQAHLSLAERSAAAGLVLLKNDADVLPLRLERVKSIALLGPGAQHARVGGGGSSAVLPTRALSPLAAMRALAGPEIEVRAAAGAPLEGDFLGVPAGDWTALEANGGNGVAASYYSNANCEGEPVGRRIEPTIDFDWGWTPPFPDLPGDGWSARYDAEWVAPRDGEQSFVARGSDGLRVWFDGELVVDAWNVSGPEARHVFARTVVRGGRHRIRVEESKAFDHKTVGLGYLEDNPEPFATAGDPRLAMAGRKASVRGGRFAFGGVGAVGRGSREAEMERAVNLARASDLAVVFVGGSARVEGEGIDRASFALPPGQDELVSRVLDVRPDAVIVVAGGNPAAMPWAARAKAILFAWYAGQEGSFAIADALLGRVNPSGKLPVSFPKRWEDGAAFGAYPEDAPGSGRVTYKEGIYLGYRWHDARGIAPLFPFGHGLSYARWSYSAASAAVISAATADPRVDVSFGLKNVASNEGAEVAQVYVAPLTANRAPGADRPPQELKGFRKMFLAAGASTRATIRLERDAFARFDATLHRWVVDPGLYEIRIGSSSRDIRATTTVELRAVPAARYGE